MLSEQITWLFPATDVTSLLVIVISYVLGVHVPLSIVQRKILSPGAKLDKSTVKPVEFVTNVAFPLTKLQ